MIKRFFATVLSGLIFQLVIAAPPAYAQAGISDSVEAKARAEISKLGTGKQVEVKLRDNSKFKGHIIETTEDSFTVADSKSAIARTVAYADVAQVKKVSSAGSWKPWAILGGVAAGAIVTWIVVKPALCDGGAQTRGPC